MESRKRKREEELEDTIITFYAPNNRTYERIFRDRSLDDMKHGIRKKLGIAKETEITLSQIRNGKRIDLDDDDDFEALRTQAIARHTVEIRISVGQGNTTAAPNAKKKRVNWTVEQETAGEGSNGGRTSSSLHEPSSDTPASPSILKKPAASSQGEIEADSSTAPPPHKRKRLSNVSSSTRSDAEPLPTPVDTPQPSSEVSRPKKRPKPGNKPPETSDISPPSTDVASHQPTSSTSKRGKSRTNKPLHEANSKDLGAESHSEVRASPDEPSLNAVPVKKKRGRPPSKKPTDSNAPQASGSHSHGSHATGEKEFSPGVVAAAQEALATVRARHNITNGDSSKTTPASNKVPSVAGASTGEPSSNAVSGVPPAAPISASRLPIIPAGSKISEVPVQSKGEGSSESSSDSETEEESDEEEQPQHPILSQLGVSEVLQDVDMEALLRGPVKNGSILDQVPEDSSSSSEDEKMDEADVDKEDADTDRSFRRLSKRFRDVGSSDEEGEDEGDLQPPTYMDPEPDVPQQNGISAKSSALRESSSDPDEEAVEKTVLVSSVDMSPEPALSALLSRRSTNTSAPVGSAKTASSVAKGQGPIASASAVSRVTNGPSIAPSAEDTIEPAEDGAPRQKDIVEDPIETDASMRDRNGKVPAVGTGPVSAAELVNSASGPSTSFLVTPKRRGRPPKAKRDQPDTTEKPKPAEKPTPKPTPKPKPPVEAASATPSVATPQSAAQPVKRGRGRPPKVKPVDTAPVTTETPQAEVPKAPTPAQKPVPAETTPPVEPSALTPDTRPPTPTTDNKRRGRKPIPPEEKEKRDADKKAEKERKAIERAAQKAAAKEEREAKRQAEKEEKARLKEEKAKTKKPSTKSKASPSLKDNEAPASAQKQANNGIGPAGPPNPNPIPSSAVQWETLAEDGVEIPDADNSMVDELRSSSPPALNLPTLPKKTAANGKGKGRPSSRASQILPSTPASQQNSLFLPGTQTQSQFADSSLPSIHPADLHASDDSSDEDMPPLSPGSRAPKLVPAAKWGSSRFPRLSDIASQALFPDTVGTSSTPRSSQFVMGSQRNPRSSLAHDNDADDDDDDSDSDSDEDDANMSHIPKERRAGAPVQKKKGGVLAGLF
ncbi:hypothetical protein C8Q75DRAFT_97517 [Abortiporus biennis]|nr:hypothetical protein C8Q75DRAFT_97517 [Abortiporus biennis]